MVANAVATTTPDQSLSVRSASNRLPTLFTVGGDVQAAIVDEVVLGHGVVVEEVLHGLERWDAVAAL